MSTSMPKRAQAELIPAAFAFWRLGVGRLGFHRRIIPDRGRPEQGIRRGNCGGEPS
jgi:hypothetical protein